MDGGEPRRPQQPLDINALQVPVVLPVAAWNKNLEFLQKQIWCDVDGLIRAIYGQVQRQVEQRTQMSAEPPA